MLLSNEQCFGADGKLLFVPDTWNEERYKCYSFHVVEPYDGFDVSRVHPLNQRRAVAVAEALRGCPEIDFAILFGSSTNMRCNRYSDLDFMIKLRKDLDSRESRNKISLQIGELCGWKADVMWYEDNKRDSQLYRNLKYGVRIR